MKQKLLEPFQQFVPTFKYIFLYFCLLPMVLGSASLGAIGFDQPTMSLAQGAIALFVLSYCLYWFFVLAYTGGFHRSLTIAFILFLDLFPALFIAFRFDTSVFFGMPTFAFFFLSFTIPLTASYWIILIALATLHPLLPLPEEVYLYLPAVILAGLVAAYVYGFLQKGPKQICK